MSSLGRRVYSSVISVMSDREEEGNLENATTYLKYEIRRDFLWEFTERQLDRMTEFAVKGYRFGEIEYVIDIPYDLLWGDDDS